MPLVHALGNPNADSLGPCSLYVYENSDFSGDGIKVGATMNTSLKFSVQKAETKNIQYGSSPSNKIVTGASCSLETALTQPSLEVLETSIYGFRLERSADGTITGYSFGSAVGVDDQSFAVGIKLALIVGGIEVNNPLQSLYFWKASPSSEAEVVYSDADQRQINIMWDCYLDNTRLDSGGRPTFFGSGAIANIDEDVPSPNVNSHSGDLDAGADIVLIGTNFGSTVARNQVSIIDNSNVTTELTVVSVNRNRTRLTITLPATFPAGTYSITVTVNGRTGTYSITKA